MNSKAPIDPIFNPEELKFSRLTLDQLKEQDLRILFETLMTEPEHRTLSDINHLIKIMLNLQPIKKLHNASVIYHLCRSMFIAKFKEKTFIYQKQEEAQSIYIILNGKIGLYKRNSDEETQEEVIFLSEGSSFGHAYKWRQKFLPLTFEETILAVVPKRELPRIYAKIQDQKENIIRTLSKAKVFGSEEQLRQYRDLLTLHRVPFGHFLIKEGQIPKGLFYILKGNISKHLDIKSVEDERIIDRTDIGVAQYTAGDYFPKESLFECLPFSIQANSPCEVISLPKKYLKLIGWSQNGQPFKGENYYKVQLSQQEEWKQFKEQYLNQNIKWKTSQPRPMNF